MNVLELLTVKIIVKKLTLNEAIKKKEIQHTKEKYLNCKTNWTYYY